MTPDPLIPDAIESGGRPLTDRGAVALAVATVLGAWWHRPVPLAVGVIAVLVAVAIRRPIVLVRYQQSFTALVVRLKCAMCK